MESATTGLKFPGQGQSRGYEPRAAVIAGSISVCIGGCNGVEFNNLE